MTFRARPTTKPVPKRRAPHDDSRRNLYMNLGFGAVVVLAVLLFAGAAFAGWYSDHFATLATVNGEKITRDQVAQRVKIETVRLTKWQDQITAKSKAGRMPASQAQTLISYVDSLKSNIESAALSYEEDSILIRQLADKRGITITDADIAAQLTKDATAVESRHTFVITIKPEVSTGASSATDAQKQAAHDKAQKLLDGLRSGTSWEDTVKASGDTTAATGNGDLYFIDKGGTTPDTALVDAIFALTANGYTDVIEGSDGAYRIGRMTEIAAATVDTGYEQSLRDAGVDMGTYKQFDRSLVAHDKIEAQLLAEVVDNASEQRKAVKILLDANSGEAAAPGSILAKQIVYAPGDNPTTAKDLKADDPAWATAKKDADDAYAKLKAATARFVDLVASSDDATSKAQNGSLGFVTKDGGTLDAGVTAAIFATGVTSGQLLEPVKAADGYHVIQVVWAGSAAAPAASASPAAGASPAASTSPAASPDATDPVTAYVASVAAQAAKPGADLARIAADYSIDSSAATGGDIGWVAKYQLALDEQNAIFGTAKGAASVPAATVGADGYTTFDQFYVVTDIQTRKPDPAQERTLRSDAFSNWYSAIKADPLQADILEMPDATATATP
jgi:parvulin-like peptidyl-prolyl isomerase